jgi:hypothetical protein
VVSFLIRLVCCLGTSEVTWRSATELARTCDRGKFASYGRRHATSVGEVMLHGPDDETLIRECSLGSPLPHRIQNVWAASGVLPNCLQNYLKEVKVRMLRANENPPKHSVLHLYSAVFTKKRVKMRIIMLYTVYLTILLVSQITQRPIK